MLRKVVEFTDYLGRSRKRECFFNLNKAEIYEKEYSVQGGLTGVLKKIVETEDQPELIRIFKELLLQSYGEISADGMEFVKSEELAKKFEQSAAYPVLFMELASNSKAAAEFINGIMPSEFRVDMDKILAEGKTPEQLLEDIENGQIPVMEEKPAVPQVDEDKIVDMK